MGTKILGMRPVFCNYNVSREERREGGIGLEMLSKYGCSP